MRASKVANRSLRALVLALVERRHSLSLLGCSPLTGWRVARVGADLRPTLKFATRVQGLCAYLVSCPPCALSHHYSCAALQNENVDKIKEEMEKAGLTKQMVRSLLSQQRLGTSGVRGALTTRDQAVGGKQ